MTSTLLQNLLTRTGMVLTPNYGAPFCLELLPQGRS